MTVRRTTYLLSSPDPPRTSNAATRGVTKRASAMSLVIEVYILKVEKKYWPAAEYNAGMREENKNSNLELELIGENG